MTASRRRDCRGSAPRGRRVPGASLLVVAATMFPGTSGAESADPDTPTLTNGSTLAFSSTVTVALDAVGEAVDVTVPATLRQPMQTVTLPRDEVAKRVADVNVGARPITPVCRNLWSPIPDDVTWRPGRLPPPVDRPWAVQLAPSFTDSVPRGKGRQFRRVIASVFAVHLPIGRLRYVTPCGKTGWPESTPTLEMLQARPPTRVRFIIAPQVTRWSDASQSAEAAVVVYQVTPSGLIIRGRADVKATAAVLNAGAPRAGAAWEPSARTLARELATALAHRTGAIDGLHLAARAFDRVGDRLRFRLGEAEGVGVDKTFVLVRSGGDIRDYEGYGRVRRVGTGAGTSAALSTLELVSGGEFALDPDIRLVEWPRLGLMFGVSGGLLPLSHDEMDLRTNEVLGAVSFVPAATLNVAYDLPFGSEWFAHAKVSLASEAAAVPLFVDAGVEKRWYWGPFVPRLGVDASLALYGLRARGPGSVRTQLAFGRAAGVAGYAGLGWQLSPDYAVGLTGGYRMFPSQVTKFVVGDAYFVGTTIDGAPFSVEFSGPYAQLAIEYWL